jgi:hypothetical protein
VGIYEVITDVLTASVLLNTKHKRQQIDSTITDIATCQAIKKVILHVKPLILIEYNYESSKAGALYTSTEGTTGQLTD